MSGILMLPRMLFYLYKLKGNFHLKPSELQRLQLKRLRALVKHAYERVSFYHDKLRDAGVKPEDVKSLNDLRKIPITSKIDIISREFKDLVSSGLDTGSLIKRTTSGSTGIPLTIFIDDRIKDLYYAVWNRALHEVGLRYRDRVAIIGDPRGFPKKKTFFQRFGVTNRTYISIFDPANKQMAQLKEFKPDVVRGYASSLFILANEFGEHLKEVSPRLVFSGAEILDAASRKLISSAFGGELFDFYACSEFGLLAWECREHDGYHINADSVLMEILDDEGEAVAPGELGRVVCTGLFNNVMPLIRYDLGDMVVPINDECTCGISLPLIKIVNGRVDDLLVATDGRLVPPTVFFPYPFDSVDWIRQFRVLQESRKNLVVQVAPKNNVDAQSLCQIIEAAERKIRELFGEDMEVKFDFVDEIPRDRSGKLRKVVSHINS